MENRKASMLIEECLNGRNKTKDKLDGLMKRYELKRTKCETCMFRYTHPEEDIPSYPCDICLDRPTRSKDKSEYIAEFSEEEKASIKDGYIESEKREGKYDY